MKFAIYALCLFAVAGCVDTSGPIYKRPSEWTPADHQAFSATAAGSKLPTLMAFCRNYRSGRAGAEALTPTDFENYEAIFTGAGMSARDIGLLRSRDQSFGTRQTFLGLSCSLGRIPEVNKSFYQGIGHNWQAIASDYRYIYLKGDGSLTGMRVTGWN
mgnify:CR=1 FL=1